jgi:hypothetical protein
VLEDGTDDAFPEKLLLGATPKDKGLIARRKGRAIAGPAMIGWGRFLSSPVSTTRRRTSPPS